MKMECTEGSACGKLVDIEFMIPDQESVDKGELPYFCIDMLDLLISYAEGKEFKTCGVLAADALTLFLEEATDAENAETVATWLEDMAKAVREKQFI